MVESTDTMKHNAEIIGKQRGCFHTEGLEINLRDEFIVCVECGYKWC